MRDITVIADLGSNYNTQKDILDAIAAVKEAGATIFKIQYFTSRRLYGINRCFQERAQIDLEQIALYCQEVGIELMCSVFHELDVPYVDRYVNRHKIAAAEASHPVLLDTIIATGKPIIISVGAVDEDTLRQIRNRTPYERTAYLYCCSEYPARNINLKMIDEIRTIVDAEVGYSDHSFDIWQTARSAVSEYGATIIEKHVYHNRVESPDIGHSISTAQLKTFCEAVQSDVADCPLPTQWFVRRPIATNHIERYQKLEYGKNWGFYRPFENHNLPPVDNFAFMAQYRANTMIAQHDIMAGQAIFPHNLQLIARS